MKTKEEAAEDRAILSQFLSDFPHEIYSEKSGFLAGVEFAEKWISVGDDMPEVGEFSLVKFKCCKGGFDHYEVDTVTLDRNGKREFSMQEYEGMIEIFWRPITHK